MKIKEAIKEIAKKTNTTENTVRTWLIKDREKLQKENAVEYEKRGRKYFVKKINIEKVVKLYS